MEIDGGEVGGVDPLAAASAGGERLGEDLAGLLEIAEQATLDDGAQSGQDLGVAQDVGGHRLGLAVPAVELAEAEAQPGARVLDGTPGGQVGGRRDQAAIGEVVARYRLDIDFTSVPTLAQRHNLRLG